MRVALGGRGMPVFVSVSPGSLLSRFGAGAGFPRWAARASGDRPGGGVVRLFSVRSVRGFASYLNIAVQEARSARGRNSVRAGRAERERSALERGGQAVPAREPGDVGTRGAGGSGGLCPEREVRNAE